MIAPRARTKAARPSLTKRILRGIALSGVALTAYFLYTRNWTADDNTKKLLLLLNIALFTPYFYYMPIDSVRSGSSIPSILYQVLISYGYTACLFGFVYTFASDFYGSNGQPFNKILHGIDGIYFSFTTLATVGFGDIYPVRTFAKGLVTLEIFVGLIYTLVLFAIVSTYVARRLDDTRDRSGPPD
jgi:hypothetical protein